MPFAPEPHLFDDGAYGGTIRGDEILYDEGWLMAGNSFGNDALLLQLLQLLDEDTFAHQREFSFDLTVASVLV